MRKIFTLLFAAVMVAPMVSAEDITMSLYTRSNSNNFKEQVPVDLMGTMKTNVTYNASTQVYSITNFLGYANGNIDFFINNEEKFTSTGGEARTAIEFIIPSNTIVKFANIAKSKYGFEIDSDMDPEWDDLTDVSDFDSGVFVGNDDTEYMGFKLVDASFWGLNENTSGAAVDNTVPRAYAIPSGSGYKFYISVDALAYKYSYGGGYSFNDYPAFVGYIIFSYPEAGAGIDEIVADNDSAVEYFNLQGVRVDNPTKGLYIKRQGSTTEKVIIR